MKNIFKSKTLWLNVLSIAAPIFIPQAQDALSSHPVLATNLLAGANFALRFLTNQPVGIPTNNSNNRFGG